MADLPHPPGRTGPPRPLGGTVAKSLTSTDRWVALTFDDGPSAFRPRALEILWRHAVPASLFDVGMRVAANPHLVAFQAREGHQVFNHTYHHPNLTKLGPAAVRAEMLDTEAVIREAGVRLPFRGMRPPFLDADDATRARLAEIGYGTVVAVHVITDDSDAATTPEQIRDAVLARLAPGAILLLHDGNVDTPAGRSVVAALPEIIQGVHDRGYRFGTIGADGAVLPAAPLRSCGEPIPPIVGPVPYLPLVEKFRGDPPQNPPDPYVIVESPHS